MALIDLTHPIEDGMITYPGLPGPSITAHVTRSASAASYTGGTTFEIGRIDMVGNTGTYLDAPWHRFEGGTDLAGLPLDATADLPVVVVDARDATYGAAGTADTADIAGTGHRGIPAAAFDGLPVTGAAVLLLTGWDRHWRTPQYGDPAPFLTRDGAEALVAGGARLVGIDSVNIDDVGDGTRPAHTALLAAGVPVLEHLTDLASLVGVAGARLHAAPAPVRGLGTVPVRAYAVVPGA